MARTLVRHPGPLPAPTSEPRSRGARLSRRRLRLVLGLLWLVDAALQAQPHLFRAAWWKDELAQSVMGQPASLSSTILWATNHVASHAAVFNAFIVATEALIGFALVLRRFEKAAIVASIPLAAGIWWVGEGFGALPTGFGLLAAGAPGPVLFYPLLGLLAWPANDHGGDGDGESAISFRRGAAAWVAVWVGGTIVGLPWKFGAARVLEANIEQPADGQPRWLTVIDHRAYATVAAHPLLVPVALAALQCFAGLGVLRSGTRTYALAVGIALNIVFWVAVQDLGTIPGGDATDVGAAPLLILLSLALLSTPRSAPPRLAGGEWAAGSRCQHLDPVPRLGL